MTEWSYERRLVMCASEQWSGWFCERCCWNVPLPDSAAERDKIVREVEKQFAQHNCESFAREHSKTDAGESANLNRD